MRTLALLLALSCQLPAQTVSGPAIRIRTSLGDIDVNLLPDAAPQTVTNFLKYANRGSYNGTFFHRSVRDFVIQTGGFTWVNGAPREIPADSPVRNEYNVSNLRGTLAMAKLGSGPDTATTQWFFNLRDNSGNLNNQNGGFTVFGRVANAAGLLVMDRIAAVRVYNAGEPFDALPLVNFNLPPIQASNLVTINSIVQLSAVPTVNAIISAGGFGAFAYAAPGSFIEIFGADLSGTTREWAGGDFVDGKAPTTLDEVRVSVDGKPAYVSYISPTQINAQIPADVTAGQVDVVVTSKGQTSQPIKLNTRPLAPGLLHDKQYVVAKPVAPGETVVLYGVGFGPVDPSSIPVAGQIVNGPSTIAATVQFTVGGQQAQVQYAGLVSGLVGLYQFNIVIPSSVTRGDQPLTATVAGELIPQTLLLPVI